MKRTSDGESERDPARCARAGRTGRPAGRVL